MKPYYEQDGITIYHGDCLEVLPDLSADLIVTSPPYNIGRHPTQNGSGMHDGSLGARKLVGGYESHADDLPHDEYAAWQRECVSAMWRSLSPEGAIFYNHKPRAFGGTMTLPTEYGPGLPLRQIIIWDRGVGINFSSSFFLPVCEWILLWAKPAFRLRDHKASAIGDVWHVRPELDGSHPAPFPLGIPARAIAATVAETVLDPFMGSGTTLRAAKNAGRKAIGIEISEAYCELAVERLAQGVLAFNA